MPLFVFQHTMYHQLATVENESSAVMLNQLNYTIVDCFDVNLAVTLSSYSVYGFYSGNSRAYVVEYDKRFPNKILYLIDLQDHLRGTGSFVKSKL